MLRVCLLLSIVWKIDKWCWFWNAQHFGDILGSSKQLGSCLARLVSVLCRAFLSTLKNSESESKVRIVRFDMWNARGNIKTQSKHSLYA